MTRIWYDCEFLEDGRTIELISIGMVREGLSDDESPDLLYLVNEAVGETGGHGLRQRIREHSWLMENVVPHLPLSEIGVFEIAGGGGPEFYLDHDSVSVLPLKHIRNLVRNFVLDRPDPELWAWYGAYDHVALCQLFGRMIDLPRGFPMWTNDLKQEVTRLERLVGQPIPLPRGHGPEHSALADALELRDRHLYLERLERDRVGD